MTNKVLKSVHMKSPVTLPRLISSGWASTWVDQKDTGLWRSRDRISHMHSYLLLMTWTIVHQITNGFRVPWTARRSNQSILKDISPEYSLEGLMLKLKLQYFGRLMRRSDSLERPDAEKDWRQEKGTIEDEMVGWHHRLDGHESEQAPGVGDGQESLVCCGPQGRKNWKRLSDWTELKRKMNLFFLH